MYKFSASPKFLSIIALTVFATSASLSTGKGRAAGSGTHAHDNEMVKLIGQPGKKADVDRTIEIDLEDNYFEPEEIDVIPGETVRFLLRNNGNFVHEFNIGTPEMHAGHQEEMAMMFEHGILEHDKINHHMMNMDMGGGHMMSHDDPNSKLLEPGETAEIIWKFAEEGTLEFACNIPGHYDAGMAGTFEFTNKVALGE